MGPGHQVAVAALRVGLQAAGRVRGACPHASSSQPAGRTCLASVLHPSSWGSTTLGCLPRSLEPHPACLPGWGWAYLGITAVPSPSDAQSSRRAFIYFCWF